MMVSKPEGRSEAPEKVAILGASSRAELLVQSSESTSCEIQYFSKLFHEKDEPIFRPKAANPGINNNKYKVSTNIIQVGVLKHLELGDLSVR